MSIVRLGKPLVGLLLVLAGVVPLFQYLQSFFEGNPDEYLTDVIYLQESALLNFSRNETLCGIDGLFVFGNKNSVDLLKAEIEKEQNIDNKIVDSVELIRLENVSDKNIVVEVVYADSSQNMDMVKVKPGETTILLSSVVPYSEDFSVNVPVVESVKLKGFFFDDDLLKEVENLTEKSIPDCPGQVFKYPDR